MCTLPQVNKYNNKKTSQLYKLYYKFFKDNNTERAMLYGANTIEVQDSLVRPKW